MQPDGAGGCRDDEFEGVAGLDIAGVEPRVDRFPAQQRRHAVIDGGNLGIWPGGNDADRIDLFAVRPRPGGVEAGEGHGAAVEIGDVVWPARAVGTLSPLVVAAGRDDAASVAQSVSECRLVGHRFGTGIDQQREVARVLDPTRHEAPAEQLGGAPPLALEHGDDRLGGRDVVTRRIVHHVVQHPEQLRHRFGGQQECVAAAHS